MTSVMENTVEELRQALSSKYGPLLRHNQVAEVLDVSPTSLSNTLRRSHEPNVIYLRLRTVRFGRRVRYPAVCVAEALLLERGEIEQRLTAIRKGGAGNGKRRK